MPLDGKPLHEVTKADLQELVLNKVRERKTIEYKRSLPGMRYDDKKEFLADASSFANTHGGHLLYGIQAENGIAEELIGIEDTEIDAATARLESMLRDGVRPGLTGVQVHPVRLESGKTVLVLRVGRSWALPHRVTLEGHDKFYGRSTAGKYPLDVPELRALFNLSDSLAERVRTFRAERLSKIGAGDAPVPLVNGPRTVLHMIPFSAFLPGGTPAHLKFKDLNHKCPPIGNPDGTHRLNFDGLLTYVPESGSDSLRSYVQVFRNGCIEALDAAIIGLYEEHNNRRIIPAVFFEGALIQAVGQYVEAMKHIGAQPPFVIMLSLLDVNGYVIPDPQGFSGRHSIDRDNLLLQELLLETFEFNVGKALRPMFDAIWNAAGYAASPNYDEEGHWKGRR